MAGERILVVDDEPTVLDACARALSRRRFDIETAESGAEAMTRLSSDSFDLLLTDIKMPGIDGLELLRYAQELNPDLPCVILTGHGTLDSAIDSIKLGVSGFVLKPFTLDELTRAVDLPLNKARLTRENIRLKALLPLFQVSSTLERQYEFNKLYQAMLSATREGIRAAACQLVLAPYFTSQLDSPVAVAWGNGERGDDLLTGIGRNAADWWPSVERYFEEHAEPLVIDTPSGTLNVLRRADGATADLSDTARAALERAGFLRGIVVGLISDGHLLGVLLVHEGTRSTIRAREASELLNESDREWLAILGTLCGAALMRAKMVAASAVSEERLQTVFEAAGCGLLALTAEGRITRANPMAESILGRTPTQLRGVPVMKVFEGVLEDRSSALERLKYALEVLHAGRLVRDVTLQVSRVGGDKRWLQLDAAPVLTPDGTLDQVVVSFVDITERKAAEDRGMELLREQASRAEAEAVIRGRDEFLATAAHELRTPIASLRLATQLLAQRVQAEPPTASEQFRDLAEILSAQSNKVSHLVDQLLDVSGLEAGKLAVNRSPTDLVSLVETIAADMGRWHSVGHTITVHAPARPVVVAIDAIRIEQVVWNLIDNAIKYSPLGGTIELTILRQDAEWVRVEVRDHGIGIPPDRLSHVFERFYQAADAPAGRKQPGLGLGLYISREIVDLHGGVINIGNADDGGTRVVIEIPTG